MSSEAMLPCIVCGTRLQNVMTDTDNQPSEGTEFATYGHYGSTFWDPMNGEELVLNVCDECLIRHSDRLARRQRYATIVVDEISGSTTLPVVVGRQWISREMVPWFRGHEDVHEVRIEPEEIGVLTGYDRIEWVDNWREVKQGLVGDLDTTEGTGSCKHMTFVAECTRCGARPLQGLR